MKIKILALSAVAAFMVACGGGANTPEDVTKSFHTALAEQDFDKAAGMATEEGKKNVESLKGMAGMAAMGGEAAEKKAPEIESVTCDTKETEADCTCKEKDGKETKYKLVNKDGKWLVDYKKLDLGGMEEPMEEAVEEVVEEGTEMVEEAVEGETTEESAE